MLIVYQRASCAAGQAGNDIILGWQPVCYISNVPTCTKNKLKRMHPTHKSADTADCGRSLFRDANIGIGTQLQGPGDLLNILFCHTLALLDLYT